MRTILHSSYFIIITSHVTFLKLIICFDLNLSNSYSFPSSVQTVSDSKISS